ncbi:unnamed protein product [Durusdinium trenchii]|uniref:Uncharacterized protein n=1 Tax=Durusdinium trenchii TaxID=1381693 RepID=A0ABP0IK81_9DINO
MSCALLLRWGAWLDLEAPLLVLVVKDAPKVFKPTSSGFDPQLLVPRSTTSAQAVHFQADSKGYEVPVGFHGLVGKSFRPPELHEHKPYLATKVDSWCLGWSTFYLLTAQPLFMSADPVQKDGAEDPKDAMALSKGGASKHKLGKYEVTRGASKHQLGKYEEAIADFDMAIKLDPKFAVALYKRGASKHMLGKYEEAIADFDMDINLNPKYALALDKRGASKHMLGKYEEAIADFDMAIQLNQTVQLFQSHGNIAKLAAQAYFHLGYSKQILGRYWHAEAMKDYGRASELDPKHGEYRDRLVGATQDSACLGDTWKAVLALGLVVFIFLRIFCRWCIRGCRGLCKFHAAPFSRTISNQIEAGKVDSKSMQASSIYTSSRFPDSHEASSSSSDCSSDSWVHVFSPDTCFTVLLPDGPVLAPASSLYQGAQVVAAEGRITEVAYPPEQHQVHAVIELQAGDTSLVVSRDHRMCVPVRTVEAHELRVGSEVILDCSRATGTITSVKWRHEPTIVLKIGFKPDFPVPAFARPPAMLSKGFRSKPLRRGLRKAPGTSEDAPSIPDTEGHLTP